MEDGRRRFRLRSFVVENMLRKYEHTQTTPLHFIRNSLSCPNSDQNKIYMGEFNMHTHKHTWNRVHLHRSDAPGDLG